MYDSAIHTVSKKAGADNEPTAGGARYPGEGGGKTHRSLDS